MTLVCKNHIQPSEYVQITEGKDMKVITCAGFYRTGSSAVSDFFSEFDCVNSLGSFEFRFVQDPDGISDLEYNICENPHRHNTSYAIKRFIRYSKFLNGNFYSKRYSSFFGQEYWNLTKAYIEDITELECKCWWHRDQLDHGEILYFIDRLYSKFVSIFQHGRTNISVLHNEKNYFTSIDKARFYEATKKYINGLLSYANQAKKDYIMVDQLVPPTNIERYLNYFDDIYVIVVERDPRDLYVLEKMIYRWGIMPYKNVEEFCEWYRITRKQAINQLPNSRVLNIMFEDLIYRYDDTTKKLLDFTGVYSSEEDCTQKYFIPEISKKNTKVFSKYPELKEDISYIEKKLSGFLYDY